MAFCMKNFLSYFCLVHSTDPELLDLDFTALGVPENIEAVFKIIYKLQELHNLEIESVCDKILGNEEFTSPGFYTRSILRICVKLSMNPTQWNFMLICTLIRYITIEHFYVMECYTFAYIGLQCLSEIYEICYKNLFLSEDEYESLAFHCKSLNADLLYKEDDLENSWPLYNKGSISSLIESLQNVDDDVNFEFTDSEQVLLHSLAASIQLIVTFDVVTNTSSESSSTDEDSLEETIDNSNVSSSTDKVSLEEAIDHSNVSSSTDEDSLEETIDRSNKLVNFSSRKSRVCAVCGIKCVGVISWFHHELKEKWI